MEGRYDDASLAATRSREDALDHVGTHWQSPSFLLGYASVHQPCREMAYSAEVTDRCVQAITQELQVTDRKPKPQRAATHALREMLVTPFPLATLVQQRLQRYVCEWEPFLDRVAWTEIGGLLSLVPMSWAMPVIKTYCSGWLTSSRIQYVGGPRS
eukprot:8516809-Pyramimonas_sp.AAC.1